MMRQDKRSYSALASKLQSTKLQPITHESWLLLRPGRAPDPAGRQLLQGIKKGQSEDCPYLTTKDKLHS